MSISTDLYPIKELFDQKKTFSAPSSQRLKKGNGQSSHRGVDVEGTKDLRAIDWVEQACSGVPIVNRSDYGSLRVETYRRR